MSPTAGWWTFWVLKEVAGKRFWLQWYVSDIAWCMFNEFTSSIRSTIVYKLTTFCFHRETRSEKPFTPWVVCEKPGMILSVPMQWHGRPHADSCPHWASWSQYDILIYFKSTSTPTASEFWPMTSTAHSSDTMRAAVTKADPAIALCR